MLTIIPRNLTPDINISNESFFIPIKENGQREVGLDDLGKGNGSPVHKVDTVYPQQVMSQKNNKSKKVNFMICELHANKTLGWVRRWLTSVISTLWEAQAAPSGELL